VAIVVKSARRVRSGLPSFGTTPIRTIYKAAEAGDPKAWLPMILLEMRLYPPDVREEAVSQQDVLIEFGHNVEGHSLCLHRRLIPVSRKHFTLELNTSGNTDCLSVRKLNPFHIRTRSF
jgi:hypothetical protein